MHTEIVTLELEKQRNQYKNYLSFLNLPLNYERDNMPKKTILLVESDTVLRNSRSQILSREGYYVTAVRSFEEAVCAANNEPVELCIIPVQNPGLLNMSLAQLPPTLPVLIISDRSSAQELAENTSRGIQSVIFTPFSPAKFKMSVNQIMENAQIYKESIRNEVLLNLGVANHKLAIESGIDKFIETVVQIAFSSTSSDYVSIKVNGNATGETLVKSETGTFHEPWRTIIESLDDFSDAIIISENTECNPRFLSLMNEAGISSIIRVPLVTRGNVVGAITTMKATGKRPFIESDLSFISILAWWTSMAIDNTRVYLDYFKEYLHADRLLDQISFVQEKERNRVAVEIHDGVAQWLVGASYDIKLCSKLISESNLTELEITIEKIRDVLQRSVKELRRAISNLPLPPLEELGLAGVIMKLAQKLEEDGIRCNITFPDKFPELTIPQQKTFYWLLQESFTNIQKHSQASRVDIEFTNRDDMVSIHVVDDGVGFSVDKAMSSKLSLEHIGLLGMRERADLLNGNLDIESEPGKGTSIDLSFSLLPSDVFSIART